MPLVDATGTPLSAEPKPPDAWEKSKILGALVATILIPVAAAFITGFYTGWSKDREVQGKFVELAISILKESPTNQSRTLREWSADILIKYSGIELSPAARENLVIVSAILGAPAASQAVKEVQQMLLKLDYYNGVLDGLISQKLRDAVKAFQAKNSLPVDGIMGPKTVNLIIQQSASQTAPPSNK